MNIQFYLPRNPHHLWHFDLANSLSHCGFAAVILNILDFLKCTQKVISIKNKYNAFPVVCSLVIVLHFYQIQAH